MSNQANSTLDGWPIAHSKGQVLQAFKLPPFRGGSVYTPPPGIINPGGTAGPKGPGRESWPWPTSPGDHVAEPPFIFNPGGSGVIAYPPGTISNWGAVMLGAHE